MCKVKSINTFNSLLEVGDYFKRESTCLRYMEKWLWDDKPVCPRCSGDEIWKYTDGKRWKCKGCDYIFSVKVGTIFEASKLPMRKWMMAIYLHGNMKKGLSSHQLGRLISVTQKTAWHMLQRIREVFKLPDDAPKMDVAVMCDETFVGGKNRNRHKDKKVKKGDGREFPDKTPILGILSSEGELRCIVTKDTTGNSLRPLLDKHVEKGALLITDEWNGYNSLFGHYNHNVVNHSHGRWVTTEGYTTNPVEAAWSHFKRQIIGIHHSLSRKHLQRYADEYSFRYNNKDLDETAIFNLILKNAQGKTLPYKTLVHGKENKKETGRDYGEGQLR